MHHKRDIGPYKYRVVLQVSNLNITFYFIRLNLYEERLENSYEVAVIICEMTRVLMGTFVLLGACDELKINKFVRCLPAVVHVVQYMTF